ncbi:MAG: nitroreductase family protein [Acidimicrobiia bacterium]
MTDLAPPFDTSITDALLSTTRSVRKRLDLDRPVPREVILECIALSMQAPTASNSQGWRWIVVDDPAKRARLAELYALTADVYLNAMPDSNAQGTRVRSSALHLNEVLARVPVHVIPCVEGSTASLGTLTGVAGLFGSIMPATWSFMLALRSRGLGSAWTTLHLPHADEAAELLGIPDGFLQVALLPVAYTIGTSFQPASRPLPETITSFNSWDATG